MLAEFKPVDRWLRPDIWLPVLTKSYYFSEKIKKLRSKQWLLKKKQYDTKCIIKIHCNVQCDNSISVTQVILVYYAYQYTMQPLKQTLLKQCCFYEGPFNVTRSCLMTNIGLQLSFGSTYKTFQNNSFVESRYQGLS